jgi:ABC-type Zn2+ transport system substrate-binding protein/surface adhesin
VEVNHTSVKTDEIARQLHLKLQLLDPLGQREDVDNYDGLMQRLAVDMVSCLSENAQ